MKNKIEITTAVSGRFSKIEVLDSNGSVLREIDPFNNLITDIGLARLGVDGSSTPIFNICRVGVGTATPQMSDVALQSQIASTTGVLVDRNRNLEDGYAYATYSYTFPMGAVVGNIAEVGTGWHATALDTLFSRARILDGNGNPTTITVLEDEILRVTWEYRMYWPLGDTEGVLINTGNKGGSFAWKARASRVEQWSISTGVTGQGIQLSTGASSSFGSCAMFTGGGLGAITDQPTGVIGTSVQNPTPSVSSPSGTKSILSASFGTTQGNTSGIRCLKFGVSARLEYQIEYTPDIVKTENDLVRLDVSHSWGRR